ncbi:MAG: hypothetical protein A3G24_04760 [Betaproteobacteria bacterium RIFCSPLOWO2_12_FULL_62_13]|nr:MAG: hypothetical protein A3G24_04760 [Betaproteobacteria bacterium RIFCSPLOWO2_12_FULL_62_13]
MHKAASGSGEVYSFTIVHRAPSPTFAQQAPYVVTVVVLREGPRMMTRLDGASPSLRHERRGWGYLADRP